MILRVIDGVVTFPYSISQLRKDVPNISIPANADLSPFGVHEVTYEERPSVDENNFKVSPAATPVEKNGAWVIEWVVTERSVDEKQSIIDNAANKARSQRNELLTQCDWTQLADCPLTTEEKTSYVTYRQALRDVPEQAGFPFTITWPTAP